MGIDERLLALRAKYRATKGLEEEVNWLGARVQAGEIAQKRAAFAALLGDPAAIQVAGVQCPGGLDFDPRSSSGAEVLAYLKAWGGAVAGMGWLVATRALLGFALKQLEDLRNSPGAFVSEARPDPFTQERPEELAAAHARLALRLADRLQSVLLQGEKATLTTGHWQLRLSKTTSELYLAGTALHMIVRSLHQRSAAPFLNWWTASYLPSLEYHRPRSQSYEELAAAIHAWRSEGRALGGLGADLAAIRQELVPAVLAYYDPIRVRLDRNLEQARVAHPCPLPRALEPTETERVRRCQDCNLNVFNLEGLGRDDAETLIHTATNRFCVSLYQRGDGQHQVEECRDSWAAATRELEALANVDGFFDFSARDPFENPFADPFSDPNPYRHPEGQDSVFGDDANPYAPPPMNPFEEAAVLDLFAPPADPFAPPASADPFAPPASEGPLELMPERDPFAPPSDPFAPRD